MAARTLSADHVRDGRTPAGATEDETVREAFFYELFGPFADGDDRGEVDQLALHSARYKAIVHTQPAAGFNYAHPDLRARLLPYFETVDGTLAGPRFEVLLPSDWLAVSGTRRIDPLDLAVSEYRLLEAPLDWGSAEAPAADVRIVRVRRNAAN